LTVVIDEHVDALRRRIGRHPDTAILGCTHYEIVADLFTAALPAGTKVIHQPKAVADALERYFAQHPDFDLGSSARRTFLTSGAPGPQSDRVARFWGEPLTFEAA
ncbi:MAG: glutamate racemase, partial [Caulobacteraceae bacterium]